MRDGLHNYPSYLLFILRDRGSKDDAIGTATISLTETSSQGTNGM